MNGTPRFVIASATKRSNPVLYVPIWIASSLSLLAMTKAREKGPSISSLPDLIRQSMRRTRLLDRTAYKCGRVSMDHRVGARW